MGHLGEALIGHRLRQLQPDFAIQSISARQPHEIGLGGNRLLQCRRKAADNAENLGRARRRQL